MSTNKLTVEKMAYRYAVVDMTTMTVTRYHSAHLITLPNGDIKSLTKTPTVLKCGHTDYLVLDTADTEYTKEEVQDLYQLYKHRYVVYKAGVINSRHDTINEIMERYGIKVKTKCIEDLRLSLRIMGLKLVLTAAVPRGMLCTATNSTTGDVIGPATVRDISKKLGRTSSCVAMHLPGHIMGDDTLDGYKIEYIK